MTDQLLRAITADGCYRLAVARTTDLVAEAVGRHQLDGVVALALARAMTAASLLTVAEKDFHRIGVQWVCRGPLGSIHVDVRSGGEIRGYVTRPHALAATVPELVGAGAIHVIEQTPDGRFTQGSLTLSSGEVDEDLEAWLRRSEQVPSRLRVLVDLDDRGNPRDVAGVLVQTLPGGAGSALLGDGGALSAELLDRELSAALEPAELVRRALPGATIEVLGSEPLAFACQCSRERVERGVAMLGPDELLEMIEGEEAAQVRCDFCNEDYTVDVEGLRRIRESLLD